MTLPFGLTLGKGLVYLIAALALVAMLTGLYHSIYRSGYRAGEALLAEYKAQQAAETAAQIIEVEKVVTKIEVQYRDRIVKVKEKGDVVTRTVTEYVLVPDDAACELRNGWVRVHDAAATNTPAGPPAESDREPAGIALSQATEAITHNYNVAHQWRELALGCRAFYEELKSKINKEPAS